MKTFAMRFTFGVAAAMIAAAGLLVTAKSASADEVCYEITHYKKNGTSEVIIVDAPGYWHGHYRHGDEILNENAECPVEEELPV